MSHVQAHQMGTFSPKPPGYFLIFSLRRWSLLSESIKVLPRDTLQFLCHSQVCAGLGRQLGTLEQQPEEGPKHEARERRVVHACMSPQLRPGHARVQRIDSHTSALQPATQLLGEEDNSQLALAVSCLGVILFYLPVQVLEVYVPSNMSQGGEIDDA